MWNWMPPVEKRASAPSQKFCSMWQVLHSKHLKRPNLMVKIMLPPLFTCNLTPVHFFSPFSSEWNSASSPFLNFFFKDSPRDQCDYNRHVWWHGQPEASVAASPGCPKINWTYNGERKRWHPSHLFLTRSASPPPHHLYFLTFLSTNFVSKNITY